MKNLRYDIFCFAAFVSIVLLFSDQSVLAEKKVLKSMIDIRRAPSRSSGEVVLPAQIFSSVAEVEPNNGTATAQPINPPSPSTIEGQADTSDAGDFGFDFGATDGGFDDFEDLFKFQINSPGITIALTGLVSDLDLWIFDGDGLIRDRSTIIGIASETIANDTLQAGSYFIGVSIFDADPVGPDTSDYTLTVIGDLGDPTSVEEGPNNVIPSEYRLSDNYPNPFNPSTKINYSVPETGRVLLKIYNALGQEIVTLVDKLQPAGAYEVNWAGIDSRGSRVSNGLYFYRFEAANFHQTKKMLLMK